MRNFDGKQKQIGKVAGRSGKFIRQMSYSSIEKKLAKKSAELGAVGKLKMNSESSKQDKVEKADSQESRNEKQRGESF